MRKRPLIYNLNDPQFKDEPAKLKYEDEHYDDEYDIEKDEDEIYNLGG